MIEVCVVGPGGGSRWNGLVEQSPHGSFYHLWEWGEVLSHTYGYRRYYLMAKRDGDLVGVFPLIYVKSILFCNRLISLPFCEYGGPLVNPTLNNNTAQQVISKLLGASNRLARSLGAKYIEIKGLSSSFALDVLHGLGYSDFQRYVTFRVNLTEPVEVLWRNLNKKTRNASRKAMKKGVEVVEAKRVEQLGAYYALYLRVQKRHGSPPHTCRLFQNLFEAFYQQGKMKIMLAEYLGKPIAGIMTFHWGNTIYWSSNVMDFKHRNLNPTNLLLWKTIEYESKDRNKVLDFGRTRRNTKIHHFKKGWGGKEAILKDCTRFLGDVKVPPDPSQRKYVYLSKLWSLIPVTASRYLGPHIISGLAL